jgi:hypothetical protein
MIFIYSLTRLRSSNFSIKDFLLSSKENGEARQSLGVGWWKICNALRTINYQ